jgi:hypothetical protein
VIDVVEEEVFGFAVGVITAFVLFFLAVDTSKVSVVK